MHRLVCKAMGLIQVSFLLLVGVTLAEAHWFESDKWLTNQNLGTNPRNQVQAFWPPKSTMTPAVFPQGFPLDWFSKSAKAEFGFGASEQTPVQNPMQDIALMPGLHPGQNPMLMTSQDPGHRGLPVPDQNYGQAPLHFLNLKPGQFPVPMPDQRHGQAPMLMPDQYPGQFPVPVPDNNYGQAPMQMPDQYPGQFPVPMPDNNYGQAPMQMPDQYPGQFPVPMPDNNYGQAPMQMPDQNNGRAPMQMPDLNLGQAPVQMLDQNPDQAPMQTPDQNSGQGLKTRQPPSLMEDQKPGQPPSLMEDQKPGQSPSLMEDQKPGQPPSLMEDQKPGQPPSLMEDQKPGQPPSLMEDQKPGQPPSLMEDQKPGQSPSLMEDQKPGQPPSQSPEQIPNQTPEQTPKEDVVPRVLNQPHIATGPRKKLMWHFPKVPKNPQKKPPVDFDLPRPDPAKSVAATCGERTVLVEVMQDLFKNRRLVNPRSLTLGGCAATGQDSKAHLLIFESDLQACGSVLTMTEDELIYSFNLLYNPGPLGGTSIVRSGAAGIHIECHYARRNNVSSNALVPTWIPYASTKVAEQELVFTMKLMTDDWEFERPLNQYYFGDYMKVEAFLMQFHHIPMRLFVDSCVATTVPDAKAVPRYVFVDNHGCLVDSKLTGSESHFMPRVQGDKLQFQLEVFKFYQDNSSMIYITCKLRGSPASNPIDAGHKACSFIDHRWVSADDDDKNQDCSCCDVNCALRKTRHAPTNKGLHFEAEASVGPILIMEEK